MWIDSGLVGHLQSLGWSYGGKFNFELEHGDKLDDINIDLAQVVSASGDIWLINFDYGGASSNWGAIYLQAEALRQAIAQIKTSTDKNKVVLVGHSMGGLACAAYIVGDPDSDNSPDFYQNDVARFSTLGTPFGGASLASLASVFGEVPGYDWSNALRDLSKNTSDHNNVFLFGGAETEVGTEFHPDVSCNGNAEDTIRGINEMVPGSDWPTDISYSWIIGNWIGDSDCVVDGDDQYLAVPGESKVIHAGHTSLCSSCTEPESHDAIIEALDEPDFYLNSYQIDRNVSYHGFLTRLNSAGVDLDNYIVEIPEGLQEISVGLSPLPVSNTQLRLLESDGTLVDSVIGSSGSLQLQSSVWNRQTEHYIVEVSGYVQPSDGAFGTLENACNTDDTNCPNCRAPYSLTVSNDSVTAAVDLSANPTTIATGGTTTLTAIVTGAGTGPVGAGVEVEFETQHPGNFSGCYSPGPPCTQLTDVDGVAEVQFSSSVAGTAPISATAEIGGTDTANVTIASSSLFATASPNPQNINLPMTFAVTVTDGAGNPPPPGTSVLFSTGYPGWFSGTVPQGSTSPVSVGTDVDGSASVNFTSEIPGDGNMTVTSMGVSTLVPFQFDDPSADMHVGVSVGFHSGGATYSKYDIGAQVTYSDGSPVPYQDVSFDFSPSNVGSWDQYDSCDTSAGGSCDVVLTITQEADVVVIATAGQAVGSTTFHAYIGDPGSVELTPVQTFSLTWDVYGVDFSPDGNTLVAGGNYRDLRAWNTSDWSQKWAVTTNETRIYQISISPDNSYVAVAGDDAVEIRDLTDGSFVCTAENPDDEALLVHWTSSSSIASTSFDSAFRHTSICGAGIPFPPLPSGHNFEEPSHLDFGTVGGTGLLAACTDIGDIFVWNTSGALVHQENVAAGSPANDTDFSSDGTRLAAVGYGAVKVFNTSVWSSTSYPAQAVGDRHYAVKYIDNDTKLAIGGDDKIEIINIADSTSFAVANVVGSAFEMAWNPSTEELAVGTELEKVYIFRPLDPRDDVNPPLINVTYPSDGAITNTPTITTTGRVTDGSSVSEFTINGSPVPLDALGYFTHEVSLTEGSNTITYWASDPVPNTATVTRSITLQVDRTAPVISGSSVSPLVGLPGTIFTVETTVVDGDTGVATVVADIRDPSSAVVAIVPLSNAGGNLFVGSYDSTAADFGFHTVDITAVDSSPQANSRTVVSAAVLSVVDSTNNDPNTPTGPYPTDGSAEVASNVVLTWSGGDPDAVDTVTYDVYLEAGDQTPDTLVCDDVGSPQCDPPGELTPGTTFYWYVVAEDNHGAIATGTVWWFTTAGGGPGEIFSNGFETGDVSRWTYAVGYESQTDVGLVAYYPFDGDATDQAGNDYHGIANGGLSFSAGVIGMAADLDGIDDYIDISSLGPALNSIGEGTGSISFWFRAAVDEIAGSPFWAEGDGTNYLSLGHVTYWSDTESITWAVGPCLAYLGIESGHEFFMDGLWHHVAVTMGTDFNEMYVDGVKTTGRYVGSSNGTPDTGGCMWPTSIDYVGIGRAKNGTAHHKGSIDEFRIYDRALTEAEITQLATALDTGLIAYYPLDGNSQDLSGNGLDGVENGGIQYSSGAVGQAAMFDGIDDYISVAHSPALNPTTGLSVAAWIQIQPATDSYYAVSKGLDSLPGWYRIGACRESSGEYRACGGLRAANSAVVGEPAGPLMAAGVWYHLAVTFSGSSLEFYVNGVNVYSQAVTVSLGSNTGPLTIGKHDMASHPYWTKGAIDEVRIYDRALTEMEILQLSGN